MDKLLKHFTTADIETINLRPRLVCDKDEVEIYIEFFRTISSAMKERVSRRFDGGESDEILMVSELLSSLLQARKLTLAYR